MNVAVSNKSPTQADLWASLAGMAQNGDKAAYNQLLREISSFIRNYLLKSLANPDWADDITQETLLSVHKSLKTYSADRPFTPWLMAIVNFRRTDYLRKHYNSRENRKTSLEDSEFLGTHVTNPAHAGEYKDIEAALKQLPTRQRKVFEMIKIQGYSAKEVAKQTGMSVSAVKVSAHRTMARLKEILG